MLYDDLSPPEAPREAVAPAPDRRPSKRDRRLIEAFRNPARGQE
jgi:hypothetical protein